MTTPKRDKMTPAEADDAALFDEMMDDLSVQQLEGAIRKAFLYEGLNWDDIREQLSDFEDDAATLLMPGEREPFLRHLERTL
ncbi:MAG: hypothetical protein KJO36_04270 [Acidimicrobiia bacterium]|nr:hypothetical protein [Acidimicrobiia bacterium]